MRMRLEGINSATKVLASGKKVTYWYAWRGGPRLEGQPGSPEFVASYNTAVADAPKRPAATLSLQTILDAYQDSAEFQNSLAERTQRDYKRKLKLIGKQFGDLPIGALNSRKVRQDFLGWRDELAKRSLRQADYTMVILSAALSFGVDRGFVQENHASRIKRLYDGNRVDRIWRSEDATAFLRSAPDQLYLPFMMALWTGQRQGDLLRLPWSAYDGSRIRLKQRKTGARVVVKVGKPLRAALDAEKRRSPIILLNTRGQPWTEAGFQSSFSQAVRDAGIEDLTFNDLRGTAVTLLALNNATEAEIATITGHTLTQVRSILDKNYLHRDPELADSGIEKLEKGTDFPNRLPNRGDQ